MSWKKTIYTETMKKDGYLYQLGSDKLDESAYQRLINAIKEGTRELNSEKNITFDEKDRLIVACLFEVPFMVENNVDHYASISDSAATRVDSMSQELREVIHEFVWVGLEKFYQNLEY